jgi:hypothetical protein
MAITRHDWRIHGDLLEWIATEYPGLSRAQFEAAYRLLANPDITDEAAEQVVVMLRGCSEVAAKAGAGDRAGQTTERRYADDGTRQEARRGGAAVRYPLTA